MIINIQLQIKVRITQCKLFTNVELSNITRLHHRLVNCYINIALGLFTEHVNIVLQV